MIERVIKYIIPLLALFLLPACSLEDEPGAGRRPMEFSVSISDPPQSRVSETADGMESTWSKDDKIFVSVIQGRTSSTTTCTLNEDGSISKYSPTLFWDGNSATISAYYSNIKNCKPTTDKTVDLADQRNGLAYVLYTQSAIAQRKSNIELNFYHRLAKVRIKVEGEKAADVTEASIYNFTSCSIDNSGTVTGSSPGRIKMHKVEYSEYFEANIVPTDEIPDNFISFGDDFEVQFSGINKLEAGKIYTITITAEGPNEIDINGHRAVRMRRASGSTPALWVADRNIGADSPEKPGKYFWWGDTEGHFPGDGFEFTYENGENIITYSKDLTELQNLGIVNTEGNLTEDYDAAYQQWLEGWRMPTKAELNWLVSNCESTWVFDTDNKPTGCYLKSRTTKQSIFFPLTGYISRNYLSNITIDAYYRGSTHEIVSSFKGDKHTAPYLYFRYERNQGSVTVNTGENVYGGYCIRPVSEGL